MVFVYSRSVQDESVFTLLIFHVRGVCGIFVVKGDGLLRHILERVFGGDVARWFSRYGVMVVSGCWGRV